MATLKINTPLHWAYRPATRNHRKKINFPDKLLTMAGRFGKNIASNFAIALILQSALFLPLICLVIFYYHEPSGTQATVTTLFFANIIAGMRGSGKRAVTSVFGLLVVDLLMLVILLV